MTLLIFLAGIGHVWLHDAQSDIGGHFGTSFEQTCLLDKITGIEAKAVAVPPRCVYTAVSDAQIFDQWRPSAFSPAAAPRAPPST